MGSKRNKLYLSKEDLATKKAALNASKTAVRISTALELPMQFAIEGKLVEVRPDGSRKTIKNIKNIKSKIDLPKGGKLCLIPKG